MVDVLIVEDHRLLADGLAAAFQRGGLRTAVVVPRRRRDVQAALVSCEPRLVLLDLDLGDADVTGFDVLADVIGAGAAAVILSGSRDASLLLACLDGGAQATLPKTAPFEVVLHHVVATLAGTPPVDRARRDALADEARRTKVERRSRLSLFERLTRREAEVLYALAMGSSAEAIAATSFVSLATVRTQIRGILTKLGVGTQLAASSLAHTSGWVGEWSTASAQRR